MKDNLPMLVTMRGSRVRRIVVEIEEISKLDHQIEEAMAGANLDAEAEAELKAQLTEQDEKLLDALVVVEKVTNGAVQVHHGDPHTDPDYQRFVAEMAGKCTCTPSSNRPCDGLLAGGLCDDLHFERERDFDE